MLKHNLLIIFRNSKRNKSTFFINLIGLSTGLACALLIYLWVKDELSIDKFHANDKQLYQIMENQQLADRIETQIFTPDLLAETMIEELPEIKYAAAVTPASWFGFTLSVDEINLKETGQFVSRDFFNVFSYNLLKGDPQNVLTDKKAIVISETLAKKIFGSAENAIGKTIDWRLLNFTYQGKVSGIFEDVPPNSTMQFQFVLSFEAWKDFSGQIGRSIHWDNHAPATYVVLNSGTDLKEFNNKIAGFIKSKLANSKVTLFARSYSESYLYDKYENGIPAGGRIEYIELFSIIALFILIIACINFMNLSTAKASARFKEIGIKKAIGAQRKSLIIQYISESIIISFISLIFAIIIVEILLPQFNDITGKQLYLNYSSGVIFPLLGITILTGLISGSYPALYLSNFNPVTVLKGNINTAAGELWIRRGLVVLQFSLSIIFIVSVLVVYNQIEFIQNKNLGYNKDNIIYFSKEGTAAENQDEFLSSLRRIPGVINASSGNDNLVGSYSSTTGVNWEGKNQEEDTRFEAITCNYNLIETYGIEIAEGRSLSKEFRTDDSKIIFNEAAIKVMGLKDPIGKTIRLWGENREIIGVVKNFHFESLHEEVKPLFFAIFPDRTLNILVKINAGKEKETIEKIGRFYSEFNPGFPFNYKFLDKDFQKLYEAETRVSILSKYFAGLAIIISCLGLLGLAAFTAQRRIKEIGIRKVLGSSEFGIISLLSADFTKLVLVSIVIGLPVSYFFVKNWLDSFAYRIELNLWYFLTAGIITIFIAWITVGTQAFKAARVNPSECLRDE